LEEINKIVEKRILLFKNIIMKKKTNKKLKKVTKTNLESFTQKYKTLFSYGLLFLFSLFFLGVSAVIDKPLSTLPQTGEGSTSNITEILYNFIHTPTGTIILVISWVSYVVLLVYLFKIRFGKNLKNHK
jgi:hypothetical protein